MLYYNCNSTDITVLLQLKIKCKGDVYLFFIDYRSRTPIYEQIKEQIIMQINNGVFAPDEQLPSIRALSKELNINVNTIKRAFDELEKDAVTYSVPGRGVFVSPDPIGNEKVKASALNDIKAVINSGRLKGVEKTDLINLIDSIYKEEEK